VKRDRLKITPVITDDNPVKAKNINRVWNLQNIVWITLKIF
jgi:hypothetical protein